MAAIGSLIVGWRAWQTSAHNNAATHMGMYYAQAEQLHQILSEYSRIAAEHPDRQSNADIRHWKYRGETAYNSYLNIMDHLCMEYLSGKFPSRTFNHLLWIPVQQIFTDSQFWRHVQIFGSSPDLT